MIFRQEIDLRFGEKAFRLDLIEAFDALRDVWKLSFLINRFIASFDNHRC